MKKIPTYSIKQIVCILLASYSTISLSFCGTKFRQYCFGANTLSKNIKNATE